MPLFSTKRKSEFVLLKRLKNFIGFTPRRLQIYRQALVHRSSVNNVLLSNERLEFLGDSILNTAVSQILYEKYPDKDEGFLTVMRAKIVNRQTLNELGFSSKLCNWITIQPHTEKLESENMAGNMVEALIGSIFLDKGYERCKEVIQEILINKLNLNNIVTCENDHKSRVIEYCQKNHKQISYCTKRRVEECADKNQPIFDAQLFIDQQFVSSGSGRSKKAAEQMASKIFLESISSCSVS